MSDDRDVRLLELDEARPALDLFRAAVFHGPIDDTGWERHDGRFGLGRTYGSFYGGELVGTATSFDTRTLVPGGAALPTSAVTHVGVRPDRTRRGHLTGLMRRQLGDAADRGDVLATLNASETAIYGRYGYGVATRAEQIRVGPKATLRADAPAGGAVRMLGPQQARDELPGLYERLGTSRPGRMDRPDRWWTRVLEGRIADHEFLGAAVHEGADGPDGYVVWTLANPDPATWQPVSVVDLQADGPVAVAGLWRFLLGLDLVDTVVARKRPLDEALALLVREPRTVQIEARHDELWLRLLDVGTALAARSWGDAAPVVLRVHDPLLTGNDAAYRIGADGAKPVSQDAAPDLECGVDALAMAYLGDRRPSELVATGWWRAHDPAAPGRADALFATDAVPWCGTGF